MAVHNQEPGTHLARVFSERGAPLDRAQARGVLDTLLRLFELGALVFEQGDGANAYNMAPSDSMPDGRS